MFRPIASFKITTVCNKHCPMCSVKGFLTSMEEAVHTSPEEAASDALVLAETVEGIYLVGGEATLHPRFHEVLVAIRDVFKGKLVLVTNGARLVELARSTQLVDEVQLSILCTADLKIAKAYKKVKPKRVEFTYPTIKHIDLGGGSIACERHLDTIGVYRGMVYPCCVAGGTKEAVGTTLTPGWQERVVQIPPPCQVCVFGRNP